MQLEAGMEVEGVFWENLDRRVYSNGTIVYKVRPVPWTSVPLLCSPRLVIFRRAVWLSMGSSWLEAWQMEARSPCCQAWGENR